MGELLVAGELADNVSLYMKPTPFGIKLSSYANTLFCSLNVRPCVKTSKNVSKNAENAWVDPVNFVRRGSKQQICIESKREPN